MWRSCRETRGREGRGRAVRGWLRHRSHLPRGRHPCRRRVVPPGLLLLRPARQPSRALSELGAGRWASARGREPAVHVPVCGGALEMVGCTRRVEGCPPGGACAGLWVLCVALTWCSCVAVCSKSQLPCWPGAALVSEPVSPPRPRAPVLLPWKKRRLAQVVTVMLDRPTGSCSTRAPPTPC